MKVVEIFSSIEGEGKRAGYLCTFVRLAGCNLRCVYCDTAYAFTDAEATEMSVDEIVTAVRKLGNKRVTVTGGEPLIHEHIGELLVALSWGFEVNVETNGSIDIQKIPEMSFAQLQDFRNNHGFFTVDYKCKSSGMQNTMCLPMFRNLTAADVLKFVVGSQEDLEDAYRVIMLAQPEASVFFSPVWGDIEPVEIVNFLKKKDLQNARIQIQIHKIIWDPQKRGV